MPRFDLQAVNPVNTESPVLFTDNPDFTRHASPSPLNGAAWAGQTIGLLPGSFNPAHAGHLALAQHGLRLFGLHEVWFMVSPGNPLKSSAEMASLKRRIDSVAGLIAPHPKLRLSTLESRIASRYTVDLISFLRKKYPRTRFILLMGADNWRQFRQWRQWRRIAAMVSIAIFARPRYDYTQMGGLAAHRYRQRRLTGGDVRHLAATEPPAWAFLPIPLLSISATELRRTGKWHITPTLAAGSDV